MWFHRAREECWRIFAREYPDYVTEDERYLEAIRRLASAKAWVLDAGCGRHAPFATRMAPWVEQVVGVDVGTARPPTPGNVTLVRGNLERLPFVGGAFDLVVSRSVFEHLERPGAVFREIARVLKPGGHLVYLVPNLWDYVSLASAMVPNRLHGAIVEAIQGRPPADTFPTYYRANTRRRLRKLLKQAGLQSVRMEMLSQYPAYLMFSPRLFRLGIAYERLVRERATLAGLRSWILGTAVKPTSRVPD